jgi:hypothetical protein
MRLSIMTPAASSIMENAMAAQRGPRYSKEEFEKRGDAIYEEKVRPKIKKKDIGKFVAIDIETGEFAIASTGLKACDKLEAKVADPQTWLMRIGLKYICTFGGSSITLDAES